MEKIKRKSLCGRLKNLFGGGMAAAKIQTVMGFRVEIFCEAKNPTRPLTVWIAGTDIERGLFSKGRYAILELVK